MQQQKIYGEDHRYVERGLSFQVAFFAWLIRTISMRRNFLLDWNLRIMDDRNRNMVQEKLYFIVQSLDLLSWSSTGDWRRGEIVWMIGINGHKNLFGERGSGVGEISDISKMKIQIITQNNGKIFVWLFVLFLFFPNIISGGIKWLQRSDSPSIHAGEKSPLWRAELIGWVCK